MQSRLSSLIYELESHNPGTALLSQHRACIIVNAVVADPVEDLVLAVG
jgi:hypothetical protein